MILWKHLHTSMFVRWGVFITLAIFIFEIYQIYRVTNTIFHPIIIFLMSFYCFQNGQLLLLALNVNFNTIYIDTFQVLQKNVLFSCLSNIIAGLAGVWCVRKDKLRTYQPQSCIDRYPASMVIIAVSVGAIISGIIAMPILFIKFFYYGLTGGYYAVRAFEQNLPPIVPLLEYFFVAFCFLTIIFSSRSHIRTLVYIVLFCWFVITALCGDRTTGAAGILVLIYIKYTIRSRKNKIILPVISILLIYFIRFSYIFRNKSDWMVLLTEHNIFISFLTELGFSCFPLFLMMDIVPQTEPFLMGTQYLSSILAGIFPSSLDFSGDIKHLASNWNIYEDWIKTYYGQYTFDLGFSLNAEAYINFGWFGICAIFIICIIVMKNLAYNTTLNKNNRYSFYKVIMLLFMWITLPRRCSYYIWNALFWYVFMMGIYIHSFIYILSCIYVHKKKI